MNRAGAWLADPRVVRVCQVVIGALFAWAALAKLGDIPGFARQVHGFRAVPLAMENLVALTLPWIELVAALGLTMGVRARASAIVVLGMLATFTVAILAALARGLDIDCGCFGTADAARVGAVKVMQNAGMLVVAAVAARRPRGAVAGGVRAAEAGG
jgi:uncharacterized membrane protein YphA (DoxX/SURF4 family)